MVPARRRDHADAGEEPGRIRATHMTPPIWCAPTGVMPPGSREEPGATPHTQAVWRRPYGAPTVMMLDGATRLAV